MVIDWECSRFTKEDSPKTAREQYQYFLDVRFKRGDYSKEIQNIMNKNIPKTLDKLGL